jgi:hypothetical protein
MIEVSNHGNMFGVWRPHGKLHAELAISFGQVSAQFLVRASMGALREEIKIEIAQR